MAVSGETLVATGTLSLAEKTPWYGCPSGQIGLLSCMYTEPAFRRQGIAREIFSRLAQDGHTWGCSVIPITASQAGALLYPSLGFKRNPRFFQYRL